MDNVLGNPVRLLRSPDPQHQRPPGGDAAGGGAFQGDRRRAHSAATPRYRRQPPSRSIRLPHGDDRDRILDLQDRTQQALAHLRLLIHNLAVSQGPPKEEPTLQEIIDSSASTLAQREIVLDADLDGIERIPTLHRSELGRLLVAFIRENTLNALKYNFPRDLVSLVAEQEQDTLFISFSSPWHDQKVPEEMHGGYGLWALQDRFENAGGSLSSNRIGASWTVLASLPWNEIATPTTTARSLMSPPDGAAYA